MAARNEEDEGPGIGSPAVRRGRRRRRSRSDGGGDLNAPEELVGRDLAGDVSDPTNQALSVRINDNMMADDELMNLLFESNRRLVERTIRNRRATDDDGDMHREAENDNLDIPQSDSQGNQGRRRIEHESDVGVSEHASSSSDTENEDQDEEEEEGEGEGREGFPRHVQRALWRVILGDAGGMGPEPSTHEELLESLRRTRRLIDPRVDKAMSLIPRGSFVPQQQQGEAYMDCPLAVEHLSFNISAPHIHATCLENLKLEEGHHFLDVGSGCGLVTCYGAYLVGKKGSATGMEINDAALDLSATNLANLEDSVPEYAMQACEVRFEKHNVFLPDPKGRLYDRINVAGTCPIERIGVLLDLLKEGGKMVVPSGRNGSELQLYTKERRNMVTKEVILHVRFGDLTVPLDAEVVGETLRLNKEREKEELRRTLSNTSSLDAETSGSAVAMSIDLGDEGLQGLEAYHEDYDCMLTSKHLKKGIPAKKKVLSTKCMLFKAQFSSGMKDAGSDSFIIPDHFSAEACTLFADYLFSHGKFSVQETCDDDGTGIERKSSRGIEIKLIAELLQLGTYTSCSSLCRWCEAVLEGEISSENCVELLLVADEVGCVPCLQLSCLNFIVDNYEKIKQDSNDFEMLDSHLVKQIADRAAMMFNQVMQLLGKQARQAKARFV